MEMKEDKYSEWCVEDAARTLIRSEEIKADEKMMGLVAKKLKKQKKQIESLEDLESYIADRSEDDSEEEDEKEEKEA